MMRAAIAVFAMVALLALVAGPAMAYEYPMWETFGQVSPDRVLAERTTGGELTGAYAPYSPDARYAYGTVCSQCSPDHVLDERTSATYEAGYAPYSETEHYAFGTVHEQIPPDRVLSERLEGATEF
jgi:hypothetical protein